MRVAIYPGSFRPMHKGHIEVISKTHKMFDKVIVAFGINPEKSERDLASSMSEARKRLAEFGNISVTSFEGLLSDFIKRLEKEDSDNCVEAVIRGLRNSQDFENEKIQQYWYEDTGLTVPVIYVISGRENCHISSSAIRALEKFIK